MSYLNNKISELIESQLPNFLQEDGPKFVKFVEKYYEWLETSQIEVSVVGELNLDFSQNTYNIKSSKNIEVDGSVIETKNIYAELLNSYRLSSGNYVFFIKEFGTDPEKLNTRGFSSDDEILFENNSDNSIFNGEIKVVSYIQNANLSSKSLWNLQDIDRTLDEYIDFFMKEYLEGFPLSFPTEVDSSDIDVPEFKKFLVKHSREFYQSKGTEDSFKYFFKTVFNEKVQLKYPKEQIFKTSDNKFKNSKIIYLKPTILTLPDVVSKKIVGLSSGSSSYVESITRFFKGNKEVFSIVLNDRSITGEFVNGEIIQDEDGNRIGKVYFGGTNIEVLQTSESFSPNQKFYIDRNWNVVERESLSINDRGSILEMVVCEVNTGKITDIQHIPTDSSIDNFSVGDEVVFDDDGCFLSDNNRRTLIASVKSVVTTDDGKNAILIKMDREGKGYIKHPKIIKIGDVDIPSDSQIYEFTFTSSNVGTIKEVKIRDSGIDYSSKIIQGTKQELVTLNPVLNDNEIGLETDTNKYKVGINGIPWSSLPYQNQLYSSNTVFGTTYQEVDLNGTGVKNIKVKVSSIFDDGGRFLNNNSFLSDSKVLQDSKYYQIFSYVIETSLQVNKYKDLLKRLIHPAGMEMFGNLSLQSLENAKVDTDIKTIIPFILDGLKYYKLDGQTERNWNSEFLTTKIEDYKNIFSDSITQISSGDASTVNDPVDIILDGSGSSDVNYEMQITQPLSWDSMYQIYQIKYDSLVTGVDDKNQIFNWNPVQGTVTISIDNNEYKVIGSNTDFLSSLSVGDVISINNQLLIIQNINSDDEIITNICPSESSTDDVLYKRVLVGD